MPCLLNEFGAQKKFPADCELLGPETVYQENIEYLLKKGMLSKKAVSVVSGNSVSAYSTHPVVKNPWTRVSLRSIEPLSYSIVDLSHNLQGGKTDKIHNPAAVMDTIPYSRVSGCYFRTISFWIRIPHYSFRLNYHRYFTMPSRAQ